MTRATKLRLLQWCVTIGSLLLILRSIRLPDLPREFAFVDGVPIIAALLIALADFGVGAWRWQKLIELVSGRASDWKTLYDLYLVSFFASSFLPGIITGDALRVYYTRKLAQDSAEAAAIVLLERILGFGVLALMGLVSWVALPNRPVVALSSPSVGYGLIILSALLVVLVVFAKSQDLRVVSMRQWFRRLIGTTRAFPSVALRKPALATQVLLSTVLFQGLSVLIVYEAITAIGLPVSFVEFLPIIAVVTLLLLLPLSIQGIGVRESLYLGLLAPYGIRATAILAGVGLTYIIGLPFILWGWILFHRYGKELVTAYGAVRSLR